MLTSMFYKFYSNIFTFLEINHSFELKKLINFEYYQNKKGMFFQHPICTKFICRNKHFTLMTWFKSYILKRLILHHNNNQFLSALGTIFQCNCYLRHLSVVCL